MTDRYETLLRECLRDFEVMVSNEVEGMRTGKYHGPRMRDCLGQWESLARDARNLLNRES